MANKEHVTLLKQGVEAWNAWRRENPDIRPNLIRTPLMRAYLREADLAGAYLGGANLFGADLIGANLCGADLIGANLTSAGLIGANLVRADLHSANLSEVRLDKANLSEANLRGANLTSVDLSEAFLTGANLRYAALVETDFTNADLTGCYVYGISAWGLKLGGATQRNLVVTREDEPKITVDNIEVAQFVYLLLNNQKIRDVIDTITSKVVLILGRFTKERKQVLDALRDELRRSERNYVPILFDFEKPTSQSVTATILTLARLARFIIADLTDPSSIPYELGRIVPDTKVPVQPLLLSAKREFSMFSNLQEDYHWVLPIHHYDSLEQLLVDLNERVIGPAERKVLELRGVAKENP
jgi:hypothetical protein